MGLWLVAGSVNGLIAVAMGAFAAHGLKGLLDPAALAWVETASRYQLAHALVLLAIASFVDQGKAASSRLLDMAGASFVAGVILFCGSLYALALTGMFVFVWVTPVGGVLLLAGWSALAWYGLRLWRGP
jgi:uncharacterized membrane protein YgdD (TMEM256/DUF423 family)